jgi:hypothetical protein
MIDDSTLAAVLGLSSVVAGSWLLALDRALICGLPVKRLAFQAIACRTNDDPRRVPDRDGGQHRRADAVVPLSAPTEADSKAFGRGPPGPHGAVGNNMLSSGAKHSHGNITRCGPDDD